MSRLLILILFSVVSASFADDWGAMAIISDTMGIHGGKLCLGEASRGDIGCPSYAPSVSPTGTLTTTAISLTTFGTNWGYLGSNASYLPNLNTTNISATTLNGVSITALTISSTNIPTFLAHKTTTQTIAASTWTKVTYDSEQFDNFNSYNPSTSRFQPSIAGYYLIAANTYCGSSTFCYIRIFKNGSLTPAEGGGSIPSIATVAYLNGTTDYVEAFALSSTTTLNIESSFSGALLASGNGLAGGDNTPTGAIMAFDLAACPTGWSEYTPARGRFLRGIDNGAGNDPSGTRVAGDIQEDANKSHSHTGTTNSAGGHNHTVSALGSGSGIGHVAGNNLHPHQTASSAKTTTTSGAHTHTLTINEDGAAEARPKNVAVLYCRKD